jgi:hypothetical protein
MREAQVLAPFRTLPTATNPHTGTIATERPNEVRASDHARMATAEDGQVSMLVAVDHCATECVGLHAASKATRFGGVGTTAAEFPQRPGKRFFFRWDVGNSAFARAVLQDCGGGCLRATSSLPSASTIFCRIPTVAPFLAAFR